MSKVLKKAALVNIVANIGLFVVELVVGLIFSSISLLGDAVNSLGDVVSAVMIYFSVQINKKDPDASHQFGHTRAENIAGYTTGVLMVLLGVVIVKSSVERLLSGKEIEYDVFMLWTVVFLFLVEFVLYFYIKGVLKKESSPSLKANLQDHVNDMFIAGGIFIAVIGLKFGCWWFDAVAGIGIALYILKNGIDILCENIGFLMGKSADKKEVLEIEKIAKGVDEVLNVDDVFTQYLGTKIQAELHISLDKKMSLDRAHDVGDEVKEKIENLDYINNCFVHINTK